MHAYFTKIRSVTRAAVVAIALGGAGLAIAPAQAATTPQHSMYLAVAAHRMHAPVCLPINRIGRMLARNGYRHIMLGRGHGGVLNARADRGHWVYRLTLDRCSGRIIRSVRLHRVR